MFRPRIASTAGRNVVESSTATATTSSPPVPTERVSVIDVVITKPRNPTSTVSPEVMTAEPAVSIVRTAASVGMSPRFSSSRNRVTMNSE